MITDPRLRAVGPAVWQFMTGEDVDVTVCAGDNVRVDTSALDELAALARLADHCRRVDGQLVQLAATPDLHKGTGVPIGTVAVTGGVVVPRIVGNDVACGMRLNVVVTADGGTVDVSAFERDAFTKAARRRFFDGDRRIGLTPRQRHAVASGGVAGLLAVADHGPLGDRDGVWTHLDGEGFARHHMSGVAVTSLPVGFDDWVLGAAKGDTDVTYDTALGNVGGGNHFCELQHVSDIVDGAAAHHHGLRQGALTVMAHTGSLWAGWRANDIGAIDAATAWPAHLRRPADAMVPLSLQLAGRYMDALGAAANLASVNRLVVSLLAVGALSDVVGERLVMRLVWDAPHNYAWVEGSRVTHRKGATPAGGSGEHPVQWFGEPVIVPGSMGAPSWLCRGTGSPVTCGSACHGAGRAVRRGGADGRGDLDRFLAGFCVVTPGDGTRARPDIAAEWRRALAQEAPWMYKDVGPVVASLETADVAHRVAQLTPLATVKQV
jgi:tRNA-splicing ligase RtcB